jgi:hypothetical protein
MKLPNQQNHSSIDTFVLAFAGIWIVSVIINLIV